MAVKALTGNLKVISHVDSTLDGANRQSFTQKDDQQTFDFDDFLTAFSLGGTNGAKVDHVYVDQRTLGAGASELLNFSGGAAAGAVAIKNPHDQTISGTKLKGLIVYVNTAQGQVEIGGDATYDITALQGANGDKTKVRGVYCVGLNAGDTTGYAIATDEVLKVTNSDGVNPVTYQIVAWFEGTAA